MAKLYQSEAWMRRQVLVLRKTPEQIAKENNVSIMTVFRYLDKYKLRKT